jgi:hypothetical protein
MVSSLPSFSLKQVACSVLEELLEAVPKKVSSPLKTEFYGKEFALFRHEKR